jgi:hypothetical protein
MQRSPASATMSLLFCAAPPDVYAFLTAEAYPATFMPFPPIVPNVPNYIACTKENKSATDKAMHVIDKKTRMDIVTMNTALPDVFLKALSLQVRTSFLQRRSPLVGKKATNVFSGSESNNRNESSHSLLMDDGDIVDCPMNLPCLPSRKKKDGRPTKCRKCFIMTLDEQNKPRLSSHIYDSTVEQCYLNLLEDMVEGNPLNLENIKER